jgi:hypothetical protein
LERETGCGRAASRLVEALLVIDTDIALLSEWRATVANRLADLLDDAGFKHQIRRLDSLRGYAAGDTKIDGSLGQVKSGRLLSEAEQLLLSSLNGTRSETEAVLRNFWNNGGSPEQ